MMIIAKATLPKNSGARSYQPIEAEVIQRITIMIFFLFMSRMCVYSSIFSFGDERKSKMCFLLIEEILKQLKGFVVYNE